MTTEPKPTIDELVRTEYAWTERQREVLDFIARGRSNPEIAVALGISLDGAKWHMREILSKLGVESREEAAEYWRRRNGWHSRLSSVFRGLQWLTGPGWLALDWPQRRWWLRSGRSGSSSRSAQTAPPPARPAHHPKYPPRQLRSPNWEASTR